MSFEIITDATANLETRDARKHGIGIIPFSYFVGDEEFKCEDTDEFDDKKYYDAIRQGMTVTTSQINPGKYMEYFEPILNEGKDVLFVGLSSGISGSFNSAEIAKNELLNKYPDRSIELIDSLGAGLGEGLLALKAVEYKESGLSLEKTVELINGHRDRMYQVFTVDDLKHLCRTGRLSNVGAIVGSLLKIKPLLKGNETGQIVATSKIRGRKQAIKAMVEKFVDLAVKPESQLIGISHADCKEDADYLVNLLKEKFLLKDLLMVKHEPVTGSHIGPGSLALFFEGAEGVRLK